MTPQDAMGEYAVVESDAHKVYRQYWIDRFNAAGIPVVAIDSKWNTSFECLDHNGYQLKFYIWPSHYDGVKIEVRTLNNPSLVWENWVDVKIKSESGFQKFLRRLAFKDFVIP